MIGRSRFFRFSSLGYWRSAPVISLWLRENSMRFSSCAFAPALNQQPQCKTSENSCISLLVDESTQGQAHGYGYLAEQARPGHASVLVLILEYLGKFDLCARHVKIEQG